MIRRWLALLISILSAFGCKAPPPAVPAPRDWLLPYTGNFSWHLLSPMGFARSCFSAGLLKDKLFAIDGDGQGSVEAFDLSVGDGWSSAYPKLPKAHYLAASAALEDRILLAGGLDVSSGRYYKDLLSFSPSENAWKSGPPMANARGCAAGAALKGRFFVFGGENNAGVLNLSEAYEARTDRWQTLAPMPTARSGAAAAVWKDKFYLFGGTVASGITGAVEVYDPARNTWSQCAPMPTPRNMLCAETIGDRIFAFGGVDDLGRDLATFEVYDPAKDSWRIGPAMPAPRSACKSAVYRDRLFVLGGTSGSNNVLRTLELFVP